MAAAAPSIAIFVAARIAQGVAGAALLTAALVMIGHAHPAGRARVKATGIWGATLGGGIAAGPLLSSVLAQRMITRHRLVLGLAVCLLGLLWLARLSPAAGWAQLLPGMVVTGLGTGLTNAALGQLAVSSAPADQPGPGIGANNTARYLGGAAGIAIVVALAVPTSARRTTSQFVAGWDTAAARGCPGCPWHAAWPALARS